MNTAESTTKNTETADITVAIPTPLRAYTGNKKRVKVSGRTVRDVIENLVSIYPMLRSYILEGDEVMDFVNIYVNETDVRDLEGKFDSEVGPTDLISIIPSIAGGSS